MAMSARRADAYVLPHHEAAGGVDRKRPLLLPLRLALLPHYPSWGSETTVLLSVIVLEPDDQIAVPGRPA